ncbi:MAG: hypothetical protein ACYDEA_09875, partial [Candidatus Dormibacteria bacterium]
GRLPPGARRLVWSPLRGRHAWDVARQQGEALVVDTGRGVEEPTACRTGAGVWPSDLWSNSGATRGNSWHSVPLTPRHVEIKCYPLAPPGSEFSDFEDRGAHLDPCTPVAMLHGTLVPPNSQRRDPGREFNGVW